MNEEVVVVDDTRNLKVPREPYKFSPDAEYLKKEEYNRKRYVRAIGDAMDAFRDIMEGREDG